MTFPTHEYLESLKQKQLYLKNLVEFHTNKVLNNGKLYFDRDASIELEQNGIITEISRLEYEITYLENYLNG